MVKKYRIAIIQTDIIEAKANTKEDAEEEAEKLLYEPIRRQVIAESIKTEVIEVPEEE